MRMNYLVLGRLQEKYGSQITFKYKWIRNTSIILMLSALVSGIAWILLIHGGYEIIKSETALLATTIILNIIWQYSAMIGIVTFVSYWLWHIALQVYEGIIKIIWITIMVIITLIAVWIMPQIYNSEIGALVYNKDGRYDIFLDIKYLGGIMSSDETETKTVTISTKDVSNGYYELYYPLNLTYYTVRGDYLILSHDDAKSLQNKLKWSEQSEVSLTYNADTRIVTDYKLVEKTADEDKAEEAAKTPEKVEIWLETNDKGTVLINRPEIKDYDGKLYWYVTKNGEFSECFQADLRDNFLNFAKKGEYTVTLVIDYNASTGEYTPISNTIEYTVRF